MTAALSRTFAAIAAIIFTTDAQAILVRHDYELNSQFTRYVNLANQSRFDTVGGLTVTVQDSGKTATGYCTGSLISANIVLTAAHCLQTSEGFIYQPIGSRNEGGFAPGVSLNFEGGPSLQPASRTYLGTVDRVSVFPGYAGTYASGDVALLRLSAISGSVPTNFLDIYGGTGESLPSPAFASIVGYGMLGNGRTGPVENTTNLKLGALTTVQTVPAEPNVLKSTFMSPGQIVAAGYPSNFLQGAPGHGDSGGPMIRNDLVSGKQVIVGTVGGGGQGTTLLEPKSSGDYYAEDNFWVRTSSFSSWISAEATRLSGAPVLAVAGSSVSNPLMSPTVQLSGANGPYTQKKFSFLSSSGRWTFVDPSTGVVDELVVEHGPEITGINLAGLPAGKTASLQVFNDNTGLYGTPIQLAAGAEYTFAAAASRFKIEGLNGEVATLGLSFASQGATDLVWTSTLAVPEASSWTLMLSGLVCTGLVNRRRIVAWRHGTA